MTRWLVGLVLFAGCSRQEPPPAAGSGTATAKPIVADAALVDAAAAVAPVVAIDADPFVGYPAPLAKPTTPCVLGGLWRGQPHELAFVDGGKPFASVFGVTEATASFADGVFVEASTESVRLTGYADKKRVELYAAKPFLVGGFVAPGPKLAMKYLAAKGDRLRFELALPKYAKTKVPLQGEQPCSDLAIDDETEFDARGAVDVLTEREAYVFSKKPIPLSIEAGKPPVVELQYESPQQVDVLETKAKLVRVAIHHNALNPAYHVTLFGWIPATALVEHSGGFGGSWATGGDRSGRNRPPVRNAKRVTCEGETPLVAELAGERRTVGMVMPNIVIEVPSGTEDFAEVRLGKANTELATGARWLVKRAALANCSEVNPP
jgi:hypothetical protein